MRILERLLGRETKKKGRRRDGTVLGKLIGKGVYTNMAGSEKIGYFDPEVAPFRTFSDGKTAFLGGAEADAHFQTVTATIKVFGGMFAGIEDKSVKLAYDLNCKFNFRGSKYVLQTCQEIVANKDLSEFLLVTTTIPFFLTYSTGQTVVIAEIDHELKLNALTNLLLRDTSFSNAEGSAVKAKAYELLSERKEEVEQKRQWAIEFRKSSSE